MAVSDGHYAQDVNKTISNRLPFWVVEIVPVRVILLASHNSLRMFLFMKDVLNTNIFSVLNEMTFTLYKSAVKMVRIPSTTDTARNTVFFTRTL